MREVVGGLARDGSDFFRPVRKLVSKQRVASKVIKRYDAAQTPYQRLLATGVLSPEARGRLEQQFLAVNPATLAQQIQGTVERLWTLAVIPRHGTLGSAQS